MKLFYSETHQYQVKYTPTDILKRMKEMGAVVYEDSFEFIDLAGYLCGKVEDCKEKTILTVILSMGSGVKMFYLIWIIGTLFLFSFSTYLCITERDFNWIPLLSLGFLVIGVFLSIFLSISQAASIQSDVLKKLSIKRKLN